MKPFLPVPWLSGIALVCACSQSDFALPSQAEDPKASAIRIAQAEVEQQAGLSQTDLWTSESRVVEAYPVEGAGRDRTSYYEAKVVTGGQNTGYVLVNIDETDLLVPESATTGMTLTESYREQLGRDDLRVVRYDWFRSAAVDPAGALLASRGFESDADPMATMTSLDAKARSKGVFPTYSRGAIADYYHALKASAPMAASGNIEESTQALSREFYAELKRAFNTGAHTPSWKQPVRSDGYHLGCGATAWGIVYGYWRQFKAANRLFDGQDLTYYANPQNSELATSPYVGPLIQACATAIDTKYVIADGVKSGDSKPWNMCKATKVASDLGYTATCNRYDAITEFKKFDYAYGSLTDDRPAILTVFNHFVTIEGARKTQQYTLGWHDRTVSYLVNQGWGLPAKWIWVRDWGANQHEVEASFSLFTLNMTLPASHGGVSFRNHEYKFNNWSVTWAEAEYSCARQGGYMVSIESAAENEFVRKMIPTTASRVWIGATKRSGDWTWPNGDPLIGTPPPYTNWNPGEPNGATSGETCTEMLPNGGWNDISANWSMPFICEWE